MGIVIAFIIVTAVYVGYHASQTPETGEAHDISYHAQTFALMQLVKSEQASMPSDVLLH
jgi:hypothetical protein